MSAAQKRIMSLRDEGLARIKLIDSVGVRKTSSVKVINMSGKQVRAVTPADRAEMVRLARDPTIRRDYPRLVLD